MSGELNDAPIGGGESIPASAPVEAPASQPAAEPAPLKSFDESLKSISEAAWDKHHPPRENGRFAPRNPSEAAPEQAAPESTKTPDQPEKAATEQAPTPAIDAPQSWSAEMKAKFASLPPDIQTYVAERDRDVAAQISRMGNQIKAHEPVRAILEQHRDYFQRIGREPADAFRQFVNASRHLDQDAPAAIRTLAQMYRVDLKALAEGQSQQQPAAPAVDPRLEARLRRMELETANRTKAETASREKSIVETIERFAGDKSHPYFADLQDEIAAQLHGIDPELPAEKRLEMAYDKARWAHPTIRERILSDQRKADEDKRKADAEKAAKEAKRQGQINHRPGPGSTPVKGTIEDSLRRHVDRLMPG